VPDRKLLAAAYDRSAPTYDERFRGLQQPKYLAARPWLAQASGPCLDAGGGTALLAELLPDKPWIVLDLSLGMLQQAAQRTPRLVQGDLARLPFRDGTFSLVAAFTAILDERPRALRELSRVLQSKGLLVVSFLAAEPTLTLAEIQQLRHIAGPIAAGQDAVYVLEKG
jgi:ubiquinone/menaquinone biosynthesis C-methylase UbiE